MPELPEVQTVVNDLKSAGLIGRKIVGVKVFWPQTIHKMSTVSFRRRMKGRSLKGFQRRGKYIINELSGDQYLLIHLRMTGRLLFASPESARSKHEHVIFTFDDNRQLRFHDTRKFGRFYLVHDPETVIGHLGLEPLSRAFTLHAFSSRIKRHKRLIKPLLLDQSVIAGIGNIYADEALWGAGIDPRRKSDSLSPMEIEALHIAIIKVLEQGLKNMGTTLGNGKMNFYTTTGAKGRNRYELKISRRESLPCYRCGMPVTRLIVGQRSTFVCAGCQK